MPISENEMNEIAKKVAEKLSKGLNTESHRPAPKCDFKWKDDALILECESAADRDRAKEILDTGDVVIRVKPQDEKQGK